MIKIITVNVKRAEQNVLDKFLDVEVLKAGHHGSKTSSPQAFLDKVKPEYVVVSCGKDNSYGHPHKETLDKYKDMNAQHFRTDLQGHIAATVTKDTLTWNVKSSPYVESVEVENTKDVVIQPEHSDPIKKQTDQKIPKEKFTGKTALKYVGSIKSNKYHWPTCRYAKTINAANLIEFASADDAKNRTYVPCKVCKP